MRNAFVLVIMSILIFACTGVTAEKIELAPEMKEWEPFVGKWLSEIEIRESPTAEWQKLEGTMEVRSEGYFLEVRRAFKLGEQEFSSIEIIGFDPLKRTYIASGFSSTGGHADVTSMDWNGTTLNVNFTASTAERDVQIKRVIWEFSSDSNQSRLPVNSLQMASGGIPARPKAPR